MPRFPMVLAALIALTLGSTAAAAERLVLEPYPASAPWKEVTNISRGAKFLRELIPADQKIESYKDILTAQSFPEIRGVAPADYLKTVFKGAAGQCRGVRVNGPVERQEDGRRVVYGQIYCGQQVGKPFGVNMFFKVIEGEDALYVVQREMRVPPSPVGGVQSFDASQMQAMKAMMEAQGVANTYLSNGVHLCGEGSTAPACAGAP